MDGVNLAARKNGPAHGTKTSEVRFGAHASVGGERFTVIAGPCAVESLEQMRAVASHLAPIGIHALRGGVYKPRTSPYAFQGLGLEGLDILAQVKRESGLPVITEVMSVEQIGPVAAVADVLQIGSRNMQNYELLKALGRAGKPVLLKRGLAATLHELLLAAEYVMHHGNPDVILCERGIRSFDGYTRNVLDLGAVVALKQLTHLPVIVDPSHAAGRREMVPALARAAAVCGADGVIVECHPDPDRSVSDAAQALSLETMASLTGEVTRLARYASN